MWINKKKWKYLIDYVSRNEYRMKKAELKIARLEKLSEEKMKSAEGELTKVITSFYWENYQ
mgnify:CR=1 FL=1